MGVARGTESTEEGTRLSWVHTYRLCGRLVLVGAEGLCG